MFPPVALTELQSAIVLVGFVVAVTGLFPWLLDRHSTLHRGVIVVVGIWLTLRYLWWRGTSTLPPPEWTVEAAASLAFYGIEALAGISSVSALMILSRRRSRSQEATQHARWWGANPPRVAVLIATYNEERDILLRTMVGAQKLDHGDFEVVVLDDGERDWLRDDCRQRGVRYITRTDHSDAKAGNINNALAILDADPRPPDFIAVLDADFIPHRNFLRRTLALFHDPAVGLVQTPQHFFNADPIQHNLGLVRSYPDEQRFFFDEIQPARDGWGIAFCCGTSSVTRMSALREIGGLPTDSITEDFMLTLALQDMGHRTVYLEEPLTEGLAPEGLREYITQRARWCLGLMQIARSRLGPLRRNRLRLRDRWSVIDSVLFWLGTFQFRLAALVFPLLYWFAGISVVRAEVPDVLTHFGVYYVWTIALVNFCSGGTILPIINDVSQIIAARPVTRAAWTGLLWPGGHGFSVTAKGGDRTRTVIHWQLMAPFAGILALTVAGLLLGILIPRFNFGEAGDGKMVILFWSLYNIVVLALTMLLCVELPRREKHLDEHPEQAHLYVGGEFWTVWITSLTTNTVRVRGAALPAFGRVRLEIRGIGEIPAMIGEQRRDGAVLILNPSQSAYEALLQRFHGKGGAPGTGQLGLMQLLEDLARRLSFARPPESGRAPNLIIPGGKAPDEPDDAPVSRPRDEG
ncbi:Curdlan synthase [Rhodobacteraceae bacterium WD3A24]|nr:Curdlan synthase [Rhodobacteraceae bacterium WD3A24]